MADPNALKMYLCKEREGVSGKWGPWEYVANAERPYIFQNALKSTSLETIAEQIAKMYPTENIFVKNPSFGVLARSDRVSKRQYDFVTSTELGDFIDLVDDHRKETTQNKL